MTRAIMPEFDRDVVRLLLAGHGLAAGNGTLQGYAGKLAVYATRLPGLARLRDQVKSVQAGAPAAELLTLAVMAAQLRAVEAETAEAGGELAALPATERLPTPLAPAEVRLLLGALLKPAGRRAKMPDMREAIKAAIRAERARDLRLLPAWLAALADVNLLELAATEAAPLYGEVMAAPMQAMFDPGVNHFTQAWLLKGLARIRGPAILPLVRDILAARTGVVQVAALMILAELAPAEAEPVAWEFYRHPRDPYAAKAGAQALSLLGSEPWTSNLFERLAEGGTPRVQAAGYLQACRHPAVVPRLLAMLTPELLATQFSLAKAVIELLGSRKEVVAALLLLRIWLGELFVLPPEIAADTVLANWQKELFGNLKMAAGKALEAINEPVSLAALRAAKSA